MGIPDYQSTMLPLLRATEDGEEHSLRETIEFLANEFNLTDEERKELLPSGQQAIFDNRVGWACTYMKKAGLLESTRRGYFLITERGREVIKRNPKVINDRFLTQFPEFLEFQTRKSKKSTSNKNDKKFDIVESDTPAEIIESAYQSLRNSIASDLLDTVRSCSPMFFERLVIDLLLKMGYGGSRLDAGKAIGRSGDNGIDGIIKEDKLGLDTIYIQAKRWDGTVSRPEIQKFAGALHGQRSRKGIFITTSSFSKEAWEYASSIDIKIILIDGERLTQLMMDHGVGVSTSATYEIRKIDRDYFSED